MFLYQQTRISGEGERVKWKQVANLITLGARGNFFRFEERLILRSEAAATRCEALRRGKK